MPILTIKQLRTYLTESRRQGRKWRDIGLEFPGVALGTLCRVSKDENYMPKTRALRVKLGLCQPVGHRRKFDASNRELREIGARVYIAI